MPLPIFLLLLLLAGLVLWRKKLVLAKCLAGFSLVFFYLISIAPTGNLLASYLENQYPSYQKKEGVKLDYVLVLGSGHISDKSQPISSLLSSSGLMRLVEGVRIYRLNPGSKLLVSGYRFNDEISHAQALKKVARHFGVPASDIVLAEQVKDTKEEALHWSKFAKGKHLAVVTSATHMPRSIYLFEQTIKTNQYKLHLHPAPTNYISHQNAPASWQDWFPTGRNISRVERAWHEYLGILWAKLTH